MSNGGLGGLVPSPILAPELPIRPETVEAVKPVLPPRPGENEIKKFERLPPPRIQSQPNIPRKQDLLKPKSLTISSGGASFPPPPKRGNNAIINPPNIKDVAALSHSLDASSHTEHDAEDDSSEAELANEKPPPSISSYPDSSRANRRPPYIQGRQVPLSTNMSIKHVAVSGPYLAVSSSDLTRVYNLKKEYSSSPIWTYVHPHSNNDGYKVTAIEFKPCRDINSEGSWLWVGTDKGALMEFDLLSEKHYGPAEKRGNVHTSAVNAILRCRQSLWTLDEGGKCQVWTAPEDGTGEISMGNTPRTFRVGSKWSVAFVAGWRLWVGQARQVQVYSPLMINGDAFNVTQRPIPFPQGKSAGVITCGTTLPANKDLVFLGHDDGKVSIYSQTQLCCIDVVPINIYNIGTLVGVGSVLWAGFRTGMIYVYDTSCTPWRVCKDWDAHHKMKITHLMADGTSLWRAGVGMVISVGEDGGLKLWDALLMDDWLGTRTHYASVPTCLLFWTYSGLTRTEDEMEKREVEYCTFRDLNIVLCTWNIGASKPSDLARGNPPENFLENVLRSMDSPDLIVFGFQELVDLEDKRLTARTPNALRSLILRISVE